MEHELLHYEVRLTKQKSVSGAFSRSLVRERAIPSEDEAAPQSQGERRRRLAGRL